MLFKVIKDFLRFLEELIPLTLKEITSKSATFVCDGKKHEKHSADNNVLKISRERYVIRFHKITEMKRQHPNFKL